MTVFEPGLRIPLIDMNRVLAFDYDNHAAGSKVKGRPLLLPPVEVQSSCAPSGQPHAAAMDHPRSGPGRVYVVSSGKVYHRACAGAGIDSLPGERPGIGATVTAFIQREPSGVLGRV